MTTHPAPAVGAAAARADAARPATADDAEPTLDAARAVSPITGWDRDRWAAHADALLAAVRPYASPAHSLITLPGAPGGYGTAVDGLEGFARTFLLAGFRLAGERGQDPDGLAEWYAAGIAAGTDPTSAHRWVRLDEHGQAKVEAASIALVLDLTRPWLWDRLDPAVQERVVDYLAPAVGDETYPQTNWVWFRLVVQTFLRSVGGPHSLAEMQADLATHDSFARPGGWLADGAERAFDHYAGWALHVYPTLWARMAGAADLAAPRAETDRARLDRFLRDAVALVGADGSPLVQGRSLIYRFAAAAPFWVGALAEVPSLPPGLLRRAASGMVDHFARHGAPDRRGLLTLGWHQEWRRLAQSYSGPGSPYWASKGFLGLALPADHPVWTATEEPLPVERADVLAAVAAPGWLVAGTTADGVVRVVNHGTDHATAGAATGDSPLYARLGYSTAAAPLLDEAAWTHPVDQSVVLADDGGRRSHRTGFETLEVGLTADGAAAVAASRAAAHWLDVRADGARHGSGLPGTAEPAGTLTVVSVVRGAWEVRLVRVEDAAGAARSVQVGGWPLADDDAPAGTTTAAADTPAGTLAAARTGTTAADGAPPGTTVPPAGADVRTPRLRSRLVGLHGSWTAAVVDAEDASPLGRHARVPILTGPVATGWTAVAVALGAPGPVTDNPPAARVDRDHDQDHVTVTWDDGTRTHVRLPRPRPTGPTETGGAAVGPTGREETQ
ncbi:DUF2264 domain-containing protein [Georgenia sp. TF02-10]|uniref:DUF2264 domain-containing protein n=1 Tax=Georgenia sp. TF02-10 TaxID=2917725 RepID=UPI001FA70F8A|nr:DUF2264 domain-containing protein [Georgenia sp. TF02-10]UNX53733.1 DUF2264 domain-containing protein [Georgenia sp. TF02-10]